VTKEDKNNRKDDGDPDSKERGQSTIDAGDNRLLLSHRVTLATWIS